MADDRLSKLEKLVSPQSCVGAYIRFVDIAGLVRGANQGVGLGIQFLGHIRKAMPSSTSCCFEHTEITHVDGGVDPRRDIETRNRAAVSRFGGLRKSDRAPSLRSCVPIPGLPKNSN